MHVTITHVTLFTANTSRSHGSPRECTEESGAEITWATRQARVATITSTVDHEWKKDRDATVNFGQKKKKRQDRTGHNRARFRTTVIAGLPQFLRRESRQHSTTNFRKNRPYPWPTAGDISFTVGEIVFTILLLRLFFCILICNAILFNSYLVTTDRVYTLPLPRSVLIF